MFLGALGMTLPDPQLTVAIWLVAMTSWLTSLDRIWLLGRGVASVVLCRMAVLGGL